MATAPNHTGKPRFRSRSFHHATANLTSVIVLRWCTTIDIAATRAPVWNDGIRLYCIGLTVSRFHYFFVLVSYGFTVLCVGRFFLFGCDVLLCFVVDLGFPSPQLCSRHMVNRSSEQSTVPKIVWSSCMSRFFLCVCCFDFHVEIFEALNGNAMAVAFRAMTGETNCITWDKKPGIGWFKMKLQKGTEQFVFKPLMALDTCGGDILWEKIKKYDQSNYLMGCDMDETHGSEYKREDGLVEGHAYSVHHAMEVDGHRRVLRGCYCSIRGCHLLYVVLWWLVVCWWSCGVMRGFTARLVS